jgi:hypothetical protein
MMQVKESFFFDFEENKKLKRIDLALQPDLLSEEEIVVWIRFLRN